MLKHCVRSSKNPGSCRVFQKPVTSRICGAWSKEVTCLLLVRRWLWFAVLCLHCVFIVFSLCLHCVFIVSSLCYHCVFMSLHKLMSCYVKTNIGSLYISAFSAFLLPFTSELQISFSDVAYYHVLCTINRTLSLTSIPLVSYLSFHSKSDNYSAKKPDV